MSETTQAFEQWAIVELFGHQKIAGMVTEQSIGGCSFLRVDVPSVSANTPAFTKLYGNGAIYAISFVDRDVALAAVEHFRVRPVQEYDLGSVVTEAVQRRLEASARPNYETDDDIAF